MGIKIIAAVGKNRELGGNNSLLWNLPGDRKYFRETTRGSTVIMGRKTFESIGRPLPNRKNIVITRSADFHADGVTICKSLPEALSCAGGDAFIIGGAQIYELAVEHADEIYLTEIDAEFPEADVFFPDFDRKKFTRRVVGKGADGGISYVFAIYDRKKSKIQELYTKKGIGALTPREALELLLELAGAERPVELTRELFFRFISLDKILNSEPESLLTVPGMTEKIADLIGTLPILFSVMGAAQIVGERLDMPENAKNYFKKQFEHATVEQFKFCCLDENFSPLCCLTPGVGGGAGVSVTAKSVIPEAEFYRSRAVIIAHNHPSGSCEPSAEDIAATEALRRELKAHGIRLVGHVICGVDGEAVVGGER